MKKFLQHQKGVFVLLLALFLGSGTAYAFDFYKNCSTGQRLYYNITDSENHYVEITFPGTTNNWWDGYTKPTGNISLPSTVSYNGVTYTVTGISWYAFFECTGLTGNLTIPNTVTSIGYGAFSWCTGFNGNLTLSSALTTINNRAFIGCTGLGGTLTIPSSVTNIGNSAFRGCTGFTGSLTIPNSVTSIGDEAFYYCTGFNGSLLIGNYVTTIGSGAFQECTGFTGSLSLGIRVTSLGASAFKNCSGFAQVRYNPINCANINSSVKPFEGCTGTLVIGSTVQRIPNYMFFGCSGFTGSLTIPDSVTEIGTAAFRNCTGFNGSLTLGNSLTTIGIDAFCNCNGFTGDITIPNSVTTINSYAFYYCTSFSGTLTIPSSVTSIGNGAFDHCTNITQVNYNATNCADVTSSDKPFASCGGSLTIGNDVQRIPSYMFNEGTSFTGTLTIGTGVTSVGASAFKNCTGFTIVNFNAINCGDAVYLSHPFENCGGHLYIGSYVTRIPESMFPYANFTGSLSIPSSVTSIGYEAFYSCIHFSGSLSLGSSLTTIGIYAFYDCPGFTGILTIPNSVTTLDIYAFALCTGFSSVIIGSNVNTINYGAFYYCDGLTSMTVRPETPPVLGNDVFYEVPKDIPVHVPCGSVNDYQEANGWDEFSNYEQCNAVVTVTAVPTVGGSVSYGGTYTSGDECTVHAYPSNNYIFLHWNSDGEVVSCNPHYTFTVTEDTYLEAVFMPCPSSITIVGEGEANNIYLPSYSYYKYSLTQQIYTPDELTGVSTINSISFFNAGHTETRTYNVYLKTTPKTTFSDDSDWITVTSSNLVYSGTVVMRTGLWTTLVLNTPFTYDGTSNLALIVDDNTGSYTVSPHMDCRVYGAAGYQAISIYNDGINYNPYSPSSYSGMRVMVKNQIMLNRPQTQMYNIAASSANTTYGSVTGGGQYGSGDMCHLKATANSGYTFMAWIDDISGAIVSTDANYSFLVTSNRWLKANFISDTNTNVCNLTFDLYDAYGDGWNGNYLMVDCDNGMSAKLAVPSGGKLASFTLPIENGDHVELSWIMGSWTYECSFIVSYEDGEVMYMGSNLNADFEYEFDMDCSGQFTDVTYLGDHSRANNYYLPSYSYYNYSLSEQIYTADEIGKTGIINNIAFYNQGTETKTRNYDIYLATTDKTAFESQTDWVSLTDAQWVFGGNVTMYAGKWTSIVFDFEEPFEYDGSSNLVLIMDDNTGDYTGSPHMSCLVYTTNDLQSLSIYEDYTDYDPANPYSYTGTRRDVKNQILLGITPTTVTQTVPLTAGTNWFSAYVDITLEDLQTALAAATPENAITIKSSSGNSVYTKRTHSWNTPASFVWDVAMKYDIVMAADCEITLEGMPINPAEHPITILGHGSTTWIGFPFAENMTLTEAFASIVLNGDKVKSSNGNATYTRGNWNGNFSTLETGTGYLYVSPANAEDRTFTFPTGAK